MASEPVNLKPCVHDVTATKTDKHRNTEVMFEAKTKKKAVAKIPAPCCFSTVAKSTAQLPDQIRRYAHIKHSSCSAYQALTSSFFVVTSLRSTLSKSVFRVHRKPYLLVAISSYESYSAIIAPTEAL